MVVLKFPPFFPHLHGKGKRAAISKLACVSQKRIRSYIVLALALSNEPAKFQCCITTWTVAVYYDMKDNHFVALKSTLLTFKVIVSNSSKIQYFYLAIYDILYKRLGSDFHMLIIETFQVLRRFFDLLQIYVI